MRFLIFGDVVGRAGRQAVTAALPALRSEHKPDSVIINIENAAHGNGIAPAIMPEVNAWQADAYTTGDHAWDNQPGRALLEDASLRIIRPANYPPGVPGRGYHLYTIGAWQVAIINLQGQVFMKNNPDNPFNVIDSLLQQPDIAQASIRLVDFHAEATSEKRALGWYSDGRVAALWGTHTHVPTADAQILPKGTGYISDIGMNGAYHSIIGVDIAAPLKSFRHQISFKISPAEASPWEVNAIVLDIDPQTGKTIHIASIRKILDDK